MTTSFYAPLENIRDQAYVVLPDDEAAHAARVLRKQAGDEIIVVDGEGGWYRVRLDQVGKRKASGVIVEARREVGEPGYSLRIGLALLKNRNRFETFLEKAVEMGVSEVVPLLTQRTEKASLKAQRTHNLLVAAMKQCGRSRLMRVTKPTVFGEALTETSSDTKLIAHEAVDPAHGLLPILSREQAQSCFMLIGPEGGFTEEEIEVAQQAGFTPISLGPRRLRAETAALVAASAMMLIAT
ncbi:MAG TPA: RsmE family RNA methyltransferase [Rhodothermales bacterium]|nr:RsmE family RNA methyltransferase [Rhodothermales bacterium]